jgi:hypothetical protein
MIKTLRITAITAALLAVGLLVFPAVFGARGDRAVEEFLKSPGAIEQFQRAKGDEVRGEGQISPLVKQARAFALYLDPPPPKAPPRPSKPRPAPRPKVTSAKFKLVGTSFYALHPDLSLAMIDEPGKGIRWVRQSERVGHLVIEQIKDGLVVVKDGGRTFEVAVVERPKKVNLIKSSTLDETDTESALQLQLAEQGEAALPALAEGGAAEQIGDEERTKLKAERTAALEGIVRELRAARADAESKQAGTKQEKKDGDALEKFIEAIRISEEEAKKLDSLGKKLQNGGTDPNTEPSRSAKIERKPQQPPK